MRLSNAPDVIIVGGGIAGLAAALRLRDRGLRPLVLEAEPRVGGRMTTDRVNGFVIDRGVTLLGRDFTRMRSLSRRLGLGSLMRPGDFAAAVQDSNGCRSYRARRPDDLLLDGQISLRAKVAFLRLGFDLLRHRRALEHGRSDRSERIDHEDALCYLRRLGGADLFNQVFEPGLKGPVGGNLAAVSRTILMQTVWNILVAGVWNLTGGVDRIPEAIAAQVPVLTSARALRVVFGRQGAEVEASVAGETHVLRARGAILAVPGQLVPTLCPDLPGWIAEPLARTRYSTIASVHIALRRPPAAPYAGYGFAPDLQDGIELELEHLRAPGSCPAGAGMVSAYLWDTPAWAGLKSHDAALTERALQVVRQTFPEVAGEVLFTHIVRWETGIALFPTGRLSEMTRLRRLLARWDAPLDLCGDYLDGLSSEGALRTGEQAAERLARRLAPTER
jgi:protoporphyrinogen/coproporphyrinogen III oxidase